jgi:hypothetical protein
VHSDILNALYNIKITLGEMNAKVGKEIWTGTAVDACGLHDDSNGNRTYKGNNQLDATKCWFIYSTCF